MKTLVAVETTVKIQTLYQTIMAYGNSRRHFTIRNVYAVGIMRGKKEIVIYDYDRSIRPLARLIVEGTLVSLRLGFTLSDVEEVMETLDRIMLNIDQIIKAQPKKKKVSRPLLQTSVSVPNKEFAYISEA